MSQSTKLTVEQVLEFKIAPLKAHARSIGVTYTKKTTKVELQKNVVTKMEAKDSVKGKVTVLGNLENGVKFVFITNEKVGKTVYEAVKEGESNLQIKAGNTRQWVATKMGYPVQIVQA